MNDWKSIKNHCCFETKYFFLEMKTESISWVKKKITLFYPAVHENFPKRVNQWFLFRPEYFKYLKMMMN